MTDIFINYRRESSFDVERIHEKLTLQFPAASVFLDREDIAPGESFPDRIRAAVSSAAVVLVVISRNWIGVQDPATLKRRLELADDWVRREVEIALSGSAAVIPVLLDGAPMPTARQLPKPLRGLAEKNAIALTKDHFSSDAESLFVVLEKNLDKARTEKLLSPTGERYPQAAKYVPVPLSKEQLERVIAELPQWRVVESSLDDDLRFGTGQTRVELVRDFRFAAFLDAIRFMQEVAESIDTFGHHPRWENVFRTVTVRLSTFDIGHRPSERDQVCARMIERQYEKFVARPQHS